MDILGPAGPEQAVLANGKTKIASQVPRAFRVQSSIPKVVPPKLTTLKRTKSELEWNETASSENWNGLVAEDEHQEWNETASSENWNGLVAEDEHQAQAELPESWQDGVTDGKDASWKPEADAEWFSQEAEDGRTATDVDWVGQAEEAMDEWELDEESKAQLRRLSPRTAIQVLSGLNSNVRNPSGFVHRAVQNRLWSRPYLEQEGSEVEPSSAPYHGLILPGSHGLILPGSKGSMARSEDVQEEVKEEQEEKEEEAPSQDGQFSAAEDGDSPAAQHESAQQGWREGDWSCPSCGDHQWALNSSCRICGTPKPDTAIVGTLVKPRICIPSSEWEPARVREPPKVIPARPGRPAAAVILPWQRAQAAKEDEQESPAETSTANGLHAPPAPVRPVPRTVPPRTVPPRRPVQVPPKRRQEHKLRSENLERGMIVEFHNGYRGVIESVFSALDEVWVIPELGEAQALEESWTQRKLKTAEVSFSGEWSRTLEVISTIDVPPDVEAILGIDQLEQLRDLVGMSVQLEPLAVETAQGSHSHLVVGPALAQQVREAVETIVNNVDGLEMPGHQKPAPQQMEALPEVNHSDQHAMTEQWAAGVQVWPPVLGYYQSVAGGWAAWPDQGQQETATAQISTEEDAAWASSSGTSGQEATSEIWAQEADAATDASDPSSSSASEAVQGVAAAGPSWLHLSDLLIPEETSTAPVVPPWRSQALPPPPAPQDHPMSESPPSLVAKQEVTDTGPQVPAPLREQQKRPAQDPRAPARKQPKRPRMVKEELVEEPRQVFAENVAEMHDVGVANPSITTTSGEKTVLSWAHEQHQFGHMPPLPEGWIRVPSKSVNGIYYVNLVTGQSTFDWPFELPPGWVQMTSRSTGQLYYWNAELQISQFEHPSE